MLFSDHCYGFFAGAFYGLGGDSWFVFSGFFVSAFWAYYLNVGFCSVFFAFRNQAGSAVWAKLHNTHQVFCHIPSLQLLNIFFSDTLPNQHTKQASALWTPNH